MEHNYNPSNQGMEVGESWVLGYPGLTRELPPTKKVEDVLVENRKALREMQLSIPGPPSY
jgi:hypothetical protein